MLTSRIQTSRLAIGVLCLALAPAIARAAPVGSAFTYQGNLNQASTPMTGPADLQFKLFDAATGGTQVGATLTTSGITPTAGKFSVDLDFGAAAFNGQERWLEVAVRSAGGGAFQVLSPRQRMAATPYALNAVQLNGQSPTFYQDAGNLTAGTIPSARISGAYSNALSFTNASNTFVGNGAAITNLSAANVSVGVLADGRLSANIPRLDAANVFSSTQTITNGSILRIRGGDFGNSLMELAATGVGAGWYGRIQARNDHPTLANSDPLVLNPDGGPVQLGASGNTVTVPGSLGIGTGSPSQRLEVSSSTAYRTARFSNPGTTAADAAGIEIYSASSNKAMNLVMGADGIFYLAQSSQADSGFNSSIRFNSASGTLSAKQYEIRGGADIAEPFDVLDDSGSPAPQILPGMVVSIDPNRPGKLRVSRAAYDRTVAGVISGAGGVSAGLRLRQEGTIADGEHPVALTGRVYCWVDADAGGAIRPGDLLTTSDTPGHAMKASDPQRTGGAVIGKAMTPLARGKGLVLVLVSLQ